MKNREICCWFVAGLLVLAVSRLAAAAEASWPQGDGFRFDLRTDRLIIAHSGQPVAHFVFQDSKVLRPHFAHVHAPGGVQVTRNHPPVACYRPP